MEWQLWGSLERSLLRRAAAKAKRHPRCAPGIPLRKFLHRPFGGLAALDVEAEAGLHQKRAIRCRKLPWAHSESVRQPSRRPQRFRRQPQRPLEAPRASHHQRSPRPRQQAAPGSSACSAPQLVNTAPACMSSAAHEQVMIESKTHVRFVTTRDMMGALRSFSHKLEWCSQARRSRR